MTDADKQFNGSRPFPPVSAGGSPAKEAAESSDELLGRRIGRYMVKAVLGEGGYGIVYLAQQERPFKRQVALKVIKPGMDSKQVIARFEAERQALALLDHPNIAHVFDAGTTEAGRPYFAMEYVNGLSITRHCDQEKLSIDDRLSLFLRVCEAIQYAHQKGIIHRDIKPSNILVSVENGAALPKVIDFGIAKALTERLTEQTLCTIDGQFVGTPEYMSPEQADLRHRDIDTRSDVYSLGVVLYVLLTGALPFDSQTFREGGIERIRRTIREAEPQSPSTRLSRLSDNAPAIAESRQTSVATLIRKLHTELEWIPLRAMKKECERRYQSAGELAQDIRNYRSGRPLTARPPSTMYRLQKFVRRHQPLVAAVIVATVAIGVGCAVGLMMYVRAEVQAQRSQAVGSFLRQTVLRALDPYRRQGGEVTPLSTLDAIAAGLENRFDEAPLIEAEIRHRLGRTYEPYGQWEAAIHHLERALHIRRRELGNQHPITLETMHRLAWVLYIAHRADEAEPLFQEALAERSRQFGESDARTISMRRMLACTYMRLGEYGRARQLYAETLPVARRVLGTSAELTIYLTCGMGYLAMREGDLEQAEKWYLEGYRQSRNGLGEDHGVTHNIAGSLGWLYVLRGKHRKAESMLENAVTNIGRIFGRNHPRVISKLQQLIRLYVAWDKPEQVATCWERLKTASSDGATLSAGRSDYDVSANCYTVSDGVCSGTGIGDFLDTCHFVHKKLHGDGTITARIDEINQVDSLSEAGLMIRSSLSPTGRHASVLIVPTGTISFRCRLSESGREQTATVRVKNLSWPYWLRLKREKSTLAAQYSSDGIRWEYIREADSGLSRSSEIAMDESVHIGLTVSSRLLGRTTEARFTDVELTGAVEPAGPFTLSENIDIPTYLLKTNQNNQPPTTPKTGGMKETAPTVCDCLRCVGGIIHDGGAELLTTLHGVSAGSISRSEHVKGIP